MGSVLRITTSSFELSPIEAQAATKSRLPYVQIEEFAFSDYHIVCQQGNQKAEIVEITSKWKVGLARHTISEQIHIAFVDTHNSRMSQIPKR